MLFKIDADYDTVEWYGNGPAETYWDRQHGAKLGIYQNKVADNMAQYLVPQECGAKTAVRWAKVVDRKGRGLLFTADAAKPMFFSALPYTPHEMESAKHPYELPRSITRSSVLWASRWALAAMTAGVPMSTRSIFLM